MNQSMRIQPLNSKNHDGASVVYIMSRDQRVSDNHALLAAQATALGRQLPLVVVFCLYPSSGVRAREHYSFMLDGLEQVADDLKKLDVDFKLIYGKPESVLLEALAVLDPSDVFFDFSPLHGPQQLAKTICTKTDAACHVVDTHNIIPVWAASDKQEYAAHTFRKKVHKQLEDWLIEPYDMMHHPHTSDFVVDTISFKEARQIIGSIDTNGTTIEFESGEQAAQNQLSLFIEHGLASYAVSRNDIASDKQSNLSPYLHFGQISSLRVALEVMYAVDERPLLFDQARMPDSSNDDHSRAAGMNALFEEMIVRKELSDNFCLYSEDYRTFAGITDWARATLREHKDDPREHVYSMEQFESSKTHDKIWNAAQTELTTTGKMHGYMRMYWAKKVLEWTEKPEDALEILLYLNDHYHIDGGDPNGYVGILWSIAGLHDRPWTERPIFGKVRYMNDAGLRRKFDVDNYIARFSTN